MAFIVVFLPPSFDDNLGVLQTGEPVFVQGFIPEAAIEGFDVGVLVGFPRLNQEQFDTPVANLGQYGPATELFAVVCSDCTG